MSVLTRCSILRAAALAICLAPALGLADPPTGPAFVELGHDFPGFDRASDARFVVADFDHDGKDDLAFAGYAGPSYGSTTIHVVGKDAAGNIGVKQSLTLPTAGNLARLLSFADGSGDPHLLYVDSHGTVTEWSGWPLQQVRTFPTLEGPASAVAGDIDADGLPDLVVRNEQTLAAYSLVTAAEKWSMPSGGSGELLLAQLDADNALEIVLGTTFPALIVDGATQMQDWSYPDRFGTSLAAGHLGSPTTRAFVGGYDRITAFSGMPYSPLWDFADGLYFQVNVIATVDIDGDGIDEILFNASNGNSLQVLDSVTHQLRQTSYLLGFNIAALATLSLDGDAARQLAFANNDTVAIINASDGSPLWSAQSRSASLSVAAIGDVDGDGRVELLTAAGFVPWNRSAGLEVRDMDSGKTKWIADVAADAEVYATAPYRLRVIDPLVAGDEKRILVAGTSYYDGRVLLVGGQTHAINLELGEYAGGPFDSRAVKDAVMVDMDGDGIDDILAASEPQLSWVTGAKLHAFSQAGDLLWESVGMGSGNQSINGVFAMPPAFGSGDVVVAVLPTGLRAYGRQSRLLDWTMDVINDSAFLVEHGVNGPEIAFEHDNVLSFYDAATRMFLRDVTLADPIEAATPLDGHVDRLLVSSGGRLLLLDGTDGTELTRSEFLGEHLANRDQLATQTLSPTAWRIGVGSDVGVYRYRLQLSDVVFESGFDP